MIEFCEAHVVLYSIETCKIFKKPLRLSLMWLIIIFIVASFLMWTFEFVLVVPQYNALW